MKISIENFMSISKATIDIDGITVLTGMNDSGKTTAGKLIFSLLNSTSAENKELSFIEEAFDNLEELSSKDKLTSYCHTLQPNASLPSIVMASEGEHNTTFKILGDDITLISTGKMRTPIFLLDPLTLDFYKDIFKSHRTNFLKAITETAETTPEIKKISAMLIKKINSFIKGEVVNKDGKFYFSKDGKLCHLFGSSAGARIIKTISLMLEHNSLNENSLLIIDNLDMFLHPSLQLEVSELLVDIALTLGCQILIVSISPYMIDGIHCYAHQKNFSKVKFFLSNRAGSTITLTDHSDDISPIIDELSSPIARLEELGL